MLYSLKDAARITGISYWTLSKWASLGILPATRFGYVHGVTIEDVVKVAKGRRFRPKKEKAQRIFG